MKLARFPKTLPAPMINGFRAFEITKGFRVQEEMHGSANDAAHRRLAEASAAVCFHGARLAAAIDRLDVALSAADAPPSFRAARLDVFSHLRDAERRHARIAQPPRTPKKGRDDERQ